MIINKIYITDFGKLSNLTIYPTDGLNIIYAPNESGKSTLLSFIKYMFYGTKMKKSKGDMTFKDKYMPWNGMPMSGSIEFTHCGKQYIISRSDGAKNGSRRLEVKELATGMLLNIEEPGRHFFSVGEKAFSDSCFVTDIFSITDSDDDIISLISGSDADTASYTRVRNALEEKILSISSTKRSSSELSVLNRKLGEEQSKYVSIKKDLGDITISQSSFDNKTEALKKELHRLGEIIKKEDYAKLTSQLGELSLQLNEEKANLENLNSHLSALPLADYNKTKNVKNKRNKIISTFLFAFLSLLSCLIFKNLLSLIVFFISALIVSFDGFIKKRKRFGENQNNTLRQTLEHQKEVSLKRIEDIKTAISRFEKSNPNISLSENLNYKETNSFTTDELNDIILRREKCADELKAVKMRTESLSKRYSELSAELDAHRSSIENLNLRISEVNSKLELYRMALSILDSAFSTLRDEFAPRLCADAFELLSSISQNSVTALVSNEKFEASVKINNEFKNVKSLSDGTQALVYLALRIAVCQYLSSGDAVPVFFDDVLSGFDDKRCLKMLNALGDLSHTRQIFLCTCRSREAEIPKNSKNASLIHIRKDDTNGQC